MEAEFASGWNHLNVTLQKEADFARFSYGSVILLRINCYEITGYYVKHIATEAVTSCNISYCIMPYNMFVEKTQVNLLNAVKKSVKNFPSSLKKKKKKEVLIIGNLVFSWRQSHWFIFAIVSLALGVKLTKTHLRPSPEAQCLCFLLCILLFQVLQSSLQSILS